MRSMQAVPHKNVTALRIVAPPTVIATAVEDAATWTVALGPESVAQPIPIEVVRDEVSGPAALAARMAGSTGVFWIDDPAVGDHIGVVTARGPSKSLPAQRNFVDVTLLASTQGFAVEPNVEDLTVQADGDIVRVGRPRGLALSHASAQVRRVASTISDAPQPTSLPALIDFDGWSKLGPEGFQPRYAQLMDAAAEEAGKKGGGVQARLSLARFLVGSELNYEAVGVLNLLAKDSPTLMSDPEFRGLRGAARTMVRRYKDAQADFSSPVVADDPASALWRGYIATKLADYTGAREQFQRGRQAMQQFAPKWRSRFARADAESALAVGDLGAARAALQMADVSGLDPDDQQALQLARARLMDAGGQIDQALPIYEAVAQSDYGAVGAPALLRATEIKLSKGKLPLANAVATLDSLRFRWRGDATELETIRALGKIYIARGRYRDALEALRSAGRKMPDLPTGVAVQQDLSAAFKSLFLDGLADGLEPIQALALFYDFRELTPIGADGDMMVRKMVRRLVDVDLLDQAAELLKYQVDNRLNGIARAEVSTDLATIDLMNRKPEQALLAINSSRTTLLPAAMNAERRVLEARALMELGRYDHALEVLGKDNSGEAAAVKAEIAWRQQAWPSAGQMLEAQLGDRWKSTQPLTVDEENRLLRAGVAYSLAGDDAALARLRTRYAKAAENVRAPDALKVALSGVDSGPMTAADFVRGASDADTFAGWVARMKKKLREKPAPGVPAAPAAKPAPKPTVAAGAPPKTAAKG
jgi:tetratricopeptide (TPR) repeat protein